MKIVVILFIFCVVSTCLTLSYGQTTQTNASNIPACVDWVRPGTLSSGDNTKGKVEAGLGDSIWIDVVNLDTWLDDIRTKQNLTVDQASPETLILFLNGIPIKGLHPENPNSLADTNFFSGGVNVQHLKFILDRRSDESKVAWQELLDKPVYEKRLSVSIGLDGGEQMDTSVTSDATGVETPFYLIVIPIGTGIIGAVILGASLAIFFGLAYKTDILCDTTGLLRPDGKNSFSLGRTQMAFWFFLVVASFFLLWVVTGDMDTITSSILGLIGISAGTALGSAVIDSGKTSADERVKNVVNIPSAKTEDDIVTELKKQKMDSANSLATLTAKRSQIPVGDLAGLDENQRQITSIYDKIALLKWQIQFFGMKPWKRVMYDLLGDKDVICFHRFQIFVWTIVLGIIFVAKVYNELAMPEFSPTMLALLGISAGTFIGFKLPDQKSNA